MATDDPTVKAGRLAQDANIVRARHERPVSEDEGAFDEDASASSRDLLPSAPVPSTALPEARLRPPAFLGHLEAMADIYRRTHRRMTPRTQALLEGVDLEDLLDRLRAPARAGRFQADPKARISAPLLEALSPDPGPLLVGLHDARLLEPWRLFLEGWDIWFADEQAQAGVSLFCEGEVEVSPDAPPIAFLQELSFIDGELELCTRWGDQSDRIAFDGSDVYRPQRARNYEKPTDD